MKQSNESEYIEPGRRARLTFVGFVMVFAIAGIYLKSHLDSLSLPDNASYAEIDKALDAYYRLNDYLLLFTIFQAIIFSLWFVRLANQSVKLGQFPPPGTPVLVRTRIRHGKRARISAIGTYCLAALIWLPVALPAYLKWFLS